MMEALLYRLTLVQGLTACVLLQCLLFSFSSYANKENYHPEPLFVCEQNEDEWISVQIHHRIKGIGPQKFVGIITNHELNQTIVTRMNLTKYYEGRVLFFTSGDLRVRFDRVQMQENKTTSFVQIPRWKIYTDEWTCKGPTFEENPL